MKSKVVKEKVYDVLSSLKREEFDDISVYGIDAEAEITKILQNELTKSIRRENRKNTILNILKK